MTQICPTCGDRPVTKPGLGMCNVCYSDHVRQVQAQRDHRNDQKNAYAKVQAREELRARTAFTLREAAMQRATATPEVLELAALMIEGKDFLDLRPAAQPAPLIVTPQQASVEVNTPPKPVAAPEPGLVIVHGGEEQEWGDA